MKTCNGQRAFSYRGARVWNHLDLEFFKIKTRNRICLGSLADMREGLKVLGENLANEGSDCSEEELEEST